MPVNTGYNSRMGGYGSGRQNGRPIAEHCLRVDLCWMIRKGLASPGYWQTGTLRWTCRGEPSGEVSYTSEMCDPENSWLELRYTVPNHRTGERDRKVQRILLSYSVPKLGGKRWWMHCPVNGDRVGKLYIPPGGDIFASRRAWRIGYQSQRQTDRDAVFERLFRLQKRLGCEEGWGNYPRRPKGMHHRTYDRLLQQFHHLDDICAVEMMQAIKLISRMG